MQGKNVTSHCRIKDSSRSPLMQVKEQVFLLGPHILFSSQQPVIALKQPILQFGRSIASPKWLRQAFDSI